MSCRSEISDEIRFSEFNVFADLPVVAACSQRHGGVSGAPYDSLNLGLHVGDVPEAVIENRERATAALGRTVDDLVVPRQVHGGNVAVVTADQRGRGSRSDDDALEATDGMVTADASILLAVMLADCVPVVIFDPQAPAVGVAHAGWGGTVSHVTRNVLRLMTESFGTDVESVRCGIGPSIGPVSYQVGGDVALRAREEFPEVAVVVPDGTGRYCFDLWEANRHDLGSLGVPDDRIETAAVDTYQAEHTYFSDRQTRPTGRQMMFVALGDG